MLTPLRRNILVDLGPPISNWESDIIEAPQGWKCLNLIGTLTAVGPKCVTVAREEIGRRVLMRSVVNEESRINPRQAQRYGLPAHWFLLAPEDKLDMTFQ